MLNRRKPTRARRLALVAASAVFAVTGLGACSAAGDAPEAKAGGGPSVVAPGKPGEPAKTMSAEEAAKSLPDDTPNSADFSYARMMITHHAQALVMTELAPKRAESAKVKRLAERITAAQRPEIDAMRGWLDNNGGKKRKGGHDHGSMPGMATEKQLAQLREAKGEEFDRLFLKLMITHHEGAVGMATEVLSQGNNVQVEEMATDVLAQQTAEIGRMRDMA
ncbi:DUF305 domain-containing protein [Streptomyces spiramyceticus]|uniref:DUF305 domain-containing protein n=1 Tax=Streptomyces spiramyceticus TaxID=299717 RepID=UPI00237BDAB6|nr:DUF305 domain-containing protein [Streptomyces spiramyceticus]